MWKVRNSGKFKLSSLIDRSIYFIDYMVMLKRFQTIITTMASGDMDYAQLDAFLTSQMKKRQARILIVILINFWIESFDRG